MRCTRKDLSIDLDSGTTTLIEDQQLLLPIATLMDTEQLRRRIPDIHFVGRENDIRLIKSQ